MSEKKRTPKPIPVQAPPKPLLLEDLMITWGGTDDAPQNTVTGRQIARILSVMRHTDFNLAEVDHGGDFWPMENEVVLAEHIRGIAQLLRDMEASGLVHKQDTRMLFLSSAQNLLAACMIFTGDIGMDKLFRVHAGHPAGKKGGAR